MKKFLSLLLSACLLMAVSSAFAGGQTEAATGEKREITIYIADPQEDYPLEGTRIGNYIEEHTGIKIKFEFLVGDVETKTGILLASGDYPDIIDARGQERKFVDAEVFIPLEDLIEKHAPNLKKLFAPYWNLMKEEDGHIYTLSEVVPIGEVSHVRAAGGFLLQKAVLKEAGWPLIKTLDQYFELIEEYARRHPTINGEKTIGFEPLTHSWRKWFLYSTPTNLAGYPNDGAALVDKTPQGDWKVRSYFDSQESYITYKKYNQAFLKGLFNPGGFVSDYDQYLAKLSSGRVLGVFDYFWEIDQAQKYLLNNDPERIYVALPVAFAGVEEEYMAPDPFRPHMGFAISTSCQDPVAAIKLLDFIASEEVQKLTLWGFEGQDYYVMENGRYARTAEQEERLRYPKYKREELGQDYFYLFFRWTGTYSDGNSTEAKDQPEVFFNTLTEGEKEVLKAYKVKTFARMFNPPNRERLEYYPLWSMKMEEGSEIQLMNQKINELRERYVPRLIMADEGKYDTVWAEYKAELNKYDLDKYIKYYQDKVNRRVAIARGK